MAIPQRLAGAPTIHRELDDWKLFKSQSMRIDANTAITFSLEEA